MSHNENSTDGTDHDYEHIGVVDGNDIVVADDGGEYHFPPSLKRREKAPLYSREIAFDAELTAPALSDRISRWDIVDATPDLDASGEVVYTHQNQIFLRVDGYENEIRAWSSDFYGDPEVGDTVLFDWHTEGSRVLRGEVKGRNNQTVQAGIEQSEGGDRNV